MIQITTTYRLAVESQQLSYLQLLKSPRNHIVQVVDNINSANIFVQFFVLVVSIRTLPPKQQSIKTSRNCTIVITAAW